MRNVVRVVRLALFVLVLATRSQSATAQVFREDFNGVALDPAIWQVELGDGAITVAGGFATLSCAGQTFPVATTRADPFSAGDFIVRVGLRYVSVTTCGVGFGALDNFYPFSPQGCRPFLIWQDGAGWYAYSGSTAYLYLGSGPDTSAHVYEWRYVNGQYEFLIDGVTRSVGGCAPRATAVFIGHPHPVGCSPWTSFAIDFIEISPLGTIATKDATWGCLKQIYR